MSAGIITIPTIPFAFLTVIIPSRYFRWYAALAVAVHVVIYLPPFFEKGDGSAGYIIGVMVIVLQIILHMLILIFTAYVKAASLKRKQSLAKEKQALKLS